MAIETIITLFSTLIGGGFLGVIFERRKRKAETDSIEADVLEKMQAMYKVFLDDYEKKIEELKQENFQLKSKIKELEKRLNELDKLKI